MLSVDPGPLALAPLVTIGVDPGSAPLRLYVGNLPFRCRRERIAEAFAAVGVDATGISLAWDPVVKRPRGFAFAEVATPDVAALAIERLHGSDLDGRALVVSVARARPASAPRPSTPRARPKRAAPPKDGGADMWVRGSEPLRILAIDPGSARAGVVVGDAGAERWTRAAPGDLKIIDAEQVLVDEYDLPTAAALACELGQRHDVRAMVVERGHPYTPRPPLATGDIVADNAAMRAYAAKCAGLARHYGLSMRLADLCEAIARSLGWAVRTVPRASWAHRVRPHTKGSTDAQIAAALPHYLDDASMDRLTTKDRRDAAGALLWSLLPAPLLTRVRRSKRGGPPRRVVVRTVEEVEARAARRARLKAPCPCGPHGRGRRPASCPHAPPPKHGAVAIVVKVAPLSRAARVRGLVAAGASLEAAARIVGMPYREAIMIAGVRP